MQKLFEFIEHIGKWRVLIQGRDIQSGAVTSDKLADFSIEGHHIAPGAVTEEKLAPEAVSELSAITASMMAVIHEYQEKGKAVSALVALLEQKVAELDEDIQNLAKSAAEHGYALSNNFGDSTLIGMNQKVLTVAINRIWSKLEDITGEAMQGINMIVSPTYFISEDGCKVHISATSADANGVFERIAFYANGELIPIEGYDDGIGKNCDSCTAETTIDETTEIKCVAKILGIEYTKVKTVTHYNNFFLFTGQFEDLSGIGQFMADHPEYARPVSNGMRGVYDVTCNEGDKIYVVVGSKLSGFIRADINSVEIPFSMTEQEFEKEDGTTETFRVFESVNSYHAGSYNIDING